MLRVIGNDQNLPRQEHAVASGTLPNGKPVVVNADGTVSVVAETSVSEGLVLKLFLRTLLLIVHQQSMILTHKKLL